MILSGHSSKKTASLRSNFLLLAGSLLAALLVLELIFRFFVLQSDSFGQTLVGQHWSRTYLNRPQNSLGFRDREYSPDELASKKIILVTGDSFAQGAGIRDYRKRFSNVLEGLMGEPWRVVNQSRSGWGTADETQTLWDFPARPEIVILSYYLNDIDPAAKLFGYPGPSRVEDPPRWLQPLVYRSYLFNYFYWRCYRFSAKRFLGAGYWENLKKLYADPRVLESHQRELLRFVRLCQKKKARLIVVIFPHLRYPAESGPFTRIIADFLKSQNVETLNLSDHFSARPFQALMVNSQDSHPNEAVHREVAELLKNLIAG